MMHTPPAIKPQTRNTGNRSGPSLNASANVNEPNAYFVCSEYCRWTARRMDARCLSGAERRHKDIVFALGFSNCEYRGRHSWSHNFSSRDLGLEWQGSSDCCSSNLRAFRPLYRDAESLGGSVLNVSRLWIDCGNAHPLPICWKIAGCPPPTRSRAVTLPAMKGQAARQHATASPERQSQSARGVVRPVTRERRGESV